MKDNVHVNFKVNVNVTSKVKCQRYFTVSGHDEMLGVFNG